MNRELVIFLLFLTAISLIFLLYSALRDRKNRGIVFIAAAAFIWVVGTLAEIFSMQFEAMLFWRNFTQIGVCFLPVAMLHFTMNYVGTSKKARTLWLSIIVIVALAALLLLWSDQFHHLMRTAVSLRDSQTGPVLSVKPSVFGLFLMSYVSTSHLLSEIFLLSFLKSALPSIRRQIFIIIAALGVPVIYIMIKSFFSSPLLLNYPIAISFIPMSLLLAYGISREGISALSSIALSGIFNIIDELIIITDSDGIIIDMNESAGKLFSPGDEDGRKSIADLDSDWWDLIQNRNKGRLEFIFSTGGDEKAYSVVVHPLISDRNRSLGSLSVLRDISEERRIRHHLIFRAETDGLTGCLNKSAFEAEADRSLKNRIMKGQNFALIMFDLDHFKKINDSHGHAAGDHVLKTLSSTVKGIIKEEDIFGRLGGEEFGILIENKDRPVVSDIAERIRLAVEVLDIQFGNEVINLSLSVGCAIIEPGENAEYQTVFQNADSALYKAKQQGRNRVCW